MKFGLSDSDFQLLDNLVIKPLKAQSAKVYVFGSRARGKHHPFSDIDILYKFENTKTVSNVIISKIIEDIEESSFPIKVDLVNDTELAASYRQNFEQDKVEV